MQKIAQKAIFKNIALLCAGIGIGLILFYFYGLSKNSIDMDKTKGSAKPLYWVAPMDPNYKKDKHGKSPMGMDLVPVYSKDGNKPGIKISPDTMNNIGVKVEPVTYKSLSININALGVIQENDNYVVEDRAPRGRRQSTTGLPVGE